MSLVLDAIYDQMNCHYYQLQLLIRSSFSKAEFCRHTFVILLYFTNSHSS